MTAAAWRPRTPPVTRTPSPPRSTVWPWNAGTTCWRPPRSWTLALCHGHGGYLPRPYYEDSHSPVPKDVELRTDASDIADELVSHDHRHGTSTTGDIPPALEDGCTDAERDAVRAYARREWITAQEKRPGI
ncbi:hypothetical protein ABZX40_15070 [Streptomyces sp. NPDC004610]|uniref:hypothetical protein n=1 Tax=unclassified Streptomyces TaxID=2593676 RepID=UPI0033AB96B6